ncbi:hypothetical protein M0R45_033857 [Rubus argutus]|uniref:SBP-type domain-containing protein n=1 Tax=Rubus argutus TaxID=59490 RepID=A0AAW1WKX1_RUBAR
MEWDFKDFAWDPNDEQLDQQKEENDLAALVGSSSTSSSRRRGPESTGDHHHKKLKLVSPSSSSSCLVDGCKEDLSRCREYHRRHRVCELHSKTPIVVIRGQQKRFCQQCSRFHSLVEFDEVKRSCRKRLNGHNQRRRKPKPESFYFTSKNFLSAYKGPRILHFGTPQLCATSNVRSMWPLEAKSAADNQPMLYNRHQRQMTLNLQFSTKQQPLKLLLRQPFPTSPAAAASPQSTRATADHAISSDGTTQGIGSSCALYLLSSSTNPTQSLVNTGLNHLVQSNVVNSSHSGHQQLQMKSSSEFPSYCSNYHMEDKFFLRPDPDGLLDPGAQMLPILLE